jgi:NitT/TauT family transport system permease protein
LLLIFSLDLNISQVLNSRIDLRLLITDLWFSVLRVTLSALTALFLAIFSGRIIAHFISLRLLLVPVVNFIRHISPFAWLPFALIWFGLGEAPACFIMFIALFFPALIMTIELYDQIPAEFIEEASICGASAGQVFFLIEIPLLKIRFINMFRILWGLGFTTVIAVEMLGVDRGMGFRLLDLRYLLKYEDMIIYLITMGITGIAVDYLLRQIIKRWKLDLL